MALFKPRKAAQNNVAEAINHHMAAIKAALGDGNAKLTLVIRSELFEKPIIFTNDDPDATIAAIRTMTTRAAGNDQVHVN